MFASFIHSRFRCEYGTRDVVRITNATRSPPVRHQKSGANIGPAAPQPAPTARTLPGPSPTPEMPSVQGTPSVQSQEPLRLSGPVTKSAPTVTAKAVDAFVAETGVTPSLAVLLVGERKDSATYVRNKKIACGKVGVAQDKGRDLPASTTEGELLAIIADLNADDSVHGILVQLPLPDHINAERVIDSIAGHKDVDGGLF